ncbi:MAG: hypothetical protein EA357_11445 [Micavibrio sp.]|nr:MAG: hypothetical protein EA357_11445 [Micavibrio sp.]
MIRIDVFAFFSSGETLAQLAAGCQQEGFLWIFYPSVLRWKKRMKTIICSFNIFTSQKREKL